MFYMLVTADAFWFTGCFRTPWGLPSSLQQTMLLKYIVFPHTPPSWNSLVGEEPNRARAGFVFIDSVSINSLQNYICCQLNIFFFSLQDRKQKSLFKGAGSRRNLMSWIERTSEMGKLSLLNHPSCAILQLFPTNYWVFILMVIADISEHSVHL